MTAQAGRILVVDDDLMNRKKISMAVQALGHDTEVAEDGEEALEKLGQANYDLVLLDILMPGMDGYAVLSEMKADPDLVRKIICRNLSIRSYSRPGLEHILSAHNTGPRTGSTISRSSGRRNAPTSSWRPS